MSDGIRELSVSALAVVLVTATVAAGSPAPGPAEPAARISTFGAYSGFSAPRFDGWRRSSVYVTAGDGVRLAVDLFRPTLGGVETQERLPVVWTYTPYRRAVADGGQTFTVIDLYEWLPDVLRHGYVVACVDVRGTGASFGRFEGMFHPRESQDTHDITEWLAAQPWSSGKVGMYGQSYLGITQYMAAARRPPHLVAIFPEMAAADMYELVYKGGIDHGALLADWSARLRRRDADEAAAVPVDGDDDRRLLRAALDEHRASRAASDVFAAAPFRDSVDRLTGARPFRDWTPIGYLAEIRASQVPIYHLTGWLDRYVRDQIVMFRNLDQPQRLTIGPWAHSQMSELDYAAEHLRWWDYWLKGIDNAVLSEDPVHYYVMGAPPATAWRSARTWPLPQERRVRYWLAGGPTGTVRSVNDGVLVDSSAPALEESGDRLVVDPSATVSPNPRWTTEPAAPDLRANDEKGLTYTSPPLAASLEVTGHPVAHLWVSASATDADLFVYLEEVDEQGASRYVSEGALRASHRATADPGYDFLGLPYHRGHEADRQPLSPGEPVELAIDLFPTSTRFAAGHRIRLTVTGADAANAVTPRQPSPVLLTLLRGGRRASWLDLPVIPAVSGEDGAP